MAPKKTAAKKTPGKPDPNKSGKDARRTFEHLGRIHVLAPLTSGESEALNFLTQAADANYRAQRFKESADLLRAAEHLSFASLHPSAEETVASDLEKVIREEFEHLIERTSEHKSKHDLPEDVSALMTRMEHEARAAMQRRSYRAALEFARGAEALSHVQKTAEKLLPESQPKKQLRN